MSDIFVDGVRAVAVANGVARIELLQLKRGADASKLEPQVVATLLIPVGGLRELAAHLTNSMERIEANLDDLNDMYLAQFRHVLSGIERQEPPITPVSAAARVLSLQLSLRSGKC